MQVYTTIKELHNCIALKNTKSIGFVPTMGALHQGHLSLIKKAQSENDLIICSVFVNPKQFNNANDLKLYPKNISLDTILLENAGCDILFAPAVEEIYPNSDSNNISNVNFGNLTKVMEAKHRPGHFDGVVMVVKRLFEIVKPENAYFGEKDFQQLAIIKQLVKKYNFNINIISCPIIREDDGLAMSSRNVNLSQVERNNAAKISKILFEAKDTFLKEGAFETKKWVEAQIQSIPCFKLDYFEFAKSDDLSIEVENNQTNIRAFIAVYVGKVRLIDNIKIT